MSELETELAALGTSDARAAESRKRIRRSHLVFVLGAMLQLVPMCNGAIQPPPGPVLLVVLLFGGYWFWAVYLVFPPMWRKVWGETRSTLSCNPITLLMACAAVGAVFAVSTLVGPLGGGIWYYVKLRRTLSPAAR